MLFDQTISSVNPPQSRRTYALIIGLVLAMMLCFSPLSYGHSSSPGLIEILKGESATWTVSPGGETKFKTNWERPALSTGKVSITPNNAISTKSNITYTITGLAVGADTVIVDWFYPDFGGVNGAQSVGVIVSAPIPVPFSFEGLLHLAFQSIIIQSDILRITNQDDETEYGVDISLGQAIGKWYSANFSLDPTQVSDGAGVWATSIGSLNGVADQVLAQLDIDMNGGLATVMPDFSPLGTSSVKMTLFNGKTCVFEKSGIGSSDYPSFAPQSSTETSCGPSPKTGFLKTSMKFPDGLVSVLFGASDPVEADRIVFQAEDQSNTVDYVSDIQLRAFGLPFFELGNERLFCRQRQFGYRHETIGQSHLGSNSSGGLDVFDLIDSGNNGVSVNVGKFNGVFSSDIIIVPSLLTEGDSATTSSYGSLNGQRDQLLSTFESTVVRKNGMNYLSINPDFSPLGSATHKVRLYDGDDVVFSADDIALPCLRFEPPPYACYFCGEPPEMDPDLPLIAGLEFPERIPVTVNDSQVVNATRVVYCPQTITESVDYTQRFDVKIDSQTLNDLTAVRERVSRFTSNLLASTIGDDARIRNNIDSTKISGFDDDYNVGASWDIDKGLGLDVGYRYEFTGIDLNQPDAGYRAVYNGNIGNQEDVFIGQIKLEYQLNHNTRLTGNYVFDPNSGQEREVKVKVIQDGEDVGEFEVKGGSTGDIFLGNLQSPTSDPLPLIIAAGLRPMEDYWCYFIKFDADVVVTSPLGGTSIGREIEIVPTDGVVMPGKFTSIDLTGKNISDITITKESAQVAPKLIAISSVQPSSGGQGTVIKILGENFGTDPNALCVIIKDGNRSIPIHVTEVSDSLICGTLGAVPPDSSPTGQVMVERGQGHRGTIDLGPGLQSGVVWTWNTLDGETPAFGPGFGLILKDPNDPDDPNDGDPNDELGDPNDPNDPNDGLGDPNDPNDPNDGLGDPNDPNDPNDELGDPNDPDDPNDELGDPNDPDDPNDGLGDPNDPDDPNDELGDPNDPNDPPPNDPNGCKLFDSGVTGGKLCLTVDCEWPENSKVSISGRIRDTAHHKGLDLFAACAVFEGGPYSAFECAQRICDLLKAAWLQQAGFTINCDASDNGDGTAKITISFPPPCNIDWGNLTVCILRSGGSDNPAPSEDVDDITTKKLSTKADKDRQRHSDRISFTGNFNGDINDLINANDITIAIGTGSDIILVKTIPVNPEDIKKGKFKYKEGTDRLQLDFKKGTVKLGCKGVDLTGLGNPVTIEISFGDYVGSITITDPIPLCLLTGVADAIEITKAKVKKGTALTAQGFIAREDLNLDLTTEDVTIEWANGTMFTETITAGPNGFVRKKSGANVFVYKKPKGGPGAITAVTLDFDKCKFKVQIKNSPTTLASIGEVTLDISSDNFDADDEITLP